MSAGRHVLINGLSVGPGGGYTVARELLRNIAVARPDWRVTLALITGHEVHERMRAEPLPSNTGLHWAPTAALRQVRRRRYERGPLADWGTAEGVGQIVQLNGMIVPALSAGRSTVCHFQDPWSYRPEAWTRPRDRFIAWLKRRENARALRRAEYATWTSQYLHDLICGRLGVTPRRTCVLPNGIPPDWIERADAGVTDWSDRPLEIVTVSGVNEYKRQELVIRALPALIVQPGLEDLTYRIIGKGAPEFLDHLRRVAKELGVDDRVTLEGHVSDERVIEAFQRARAYVLMSVCESFGIPAIEAMSFGTPVVTADCCAMPEVCGEAAELVEVDNVGRLAESIARVLLDPAHAETLRRAGLQRIRQFDWSETGRRMADCLDEIATSA